MFRLEESQGRRFFLELLVSRNVCAAAGGIAGSVEKNPYHAVLEPAERSIYPMDWLDESKKQRIVQELVPGKQITLAHIIANPDPILYEKLGLNPSIDYSRAAIGIMTVSPAETAIIMADVAIKSAAIDLGFVDRFSGSLIITGTVSEVEASEQAILDYVREELKYTTCNVTRT